VLKLTPAILVLLIGASAQPARCDQRWLGSIEWWTSLSQTIVVCEVVKTEDQKLANPLRKVQRVTFRTTSVLKGTRLDNLVTTQEYLDPVRFPRRFKQFRVEHALQVGDKALLFCARSNQRKPPEAVFWVNLTKPDADISRHGPCDNTFKWLGDESSILAAVKRRMQRDARVQPTTHRGIIVTSTEVSDFYLVRTADAEFRKALLKQLQSSSEDEVELAIYNFISYPSKETINLIAPFLTDKTVYKTQTPNQHDSDAKPLDKEVAVYPLRQMAYTALTLLGESPRKPDGYRDDSVPWQPKSFFENRNRFPFGDWKRLEFAPGKFRPGIVPPEAVAQVAPADLPKAWQTICAEEKNNYQRLLWRVYHLTTNSTRGRPWKEVQRALDRKRLTQAPDVEQNSAFARYVVKQAVYGIGAGLPHDLVLTFELFVENDKAEKSIPLVERVDVRLVGPVGKAFMGIARAKLYPAGTVAARLIGDREVVNAAKKWPIVERFDIQYGYMNDLYVQFNPHAFVVTLELAGKKMDSGRSKTFRATAPSGLDPLQSWLGKMKLDGFRSQDTLEDFTISPVEE
jgi:hypothetical protein